MTEEMNEEYKHVGLQVTKDIHKKLKTMSLELDKTMTDLVAPLIKEMVDKWWEQNKGSDKK